jgi:predicted transcriptional regulator
LGTASGDDEVATEISPSGISRRSNLRVVNRWFSAKAFHFGYQIDGVAKGASERLGVSETMVIKWRRGASKCGNRPCVQCMPLWALKKILQLIPLEYRPTIQEIEENVVRYQAKGGAPVLNPRLPLMEDERLVRIFFHLVGDGYGGRFGGAKPFYYNTDPAVMEGFVNDLKVFGDVYTWFEEGKFRVFFSKAVAHVIKHIYKTNFMSHEVRVPHKFFDANAQIVAQGIKALADDEGSVSVSKIKICSSNKLFLEDALKLLERKFPELGKYAAIRNDRNSKLHNLIIRASGVKLFAEKIGFQHSRKSFDLNLFLEMKASKKVRTSAWETKLKILRGLEKGEKTVRELMYSIGLNPDVIRIHLVGYENGNRCVIGLKRLRYVRAKDIGRKRKWGITSKGRQFLYSTDHIFQSRFSGNS